MSVDFESILVTQNPLTKEIEVSAVAATGVGAKGSGSWSPPEDELTDDASGGGFEECVTEEAPPLPSNCDEQDCQAIETFLTGNPNSTEADQCAKLYTDDGNDIVTANSYLRDWNGLDSIFAFVDSTAQPWIDEETPSRDPAPENTYDFENDALLCDPVVVAEGGSFVYGQGIVDTTYRPKQINGNDLYGGGDIATKTYGENKIEVEYYWAIYLAPAADSVTTFKPSIWVTTIPEENIFPAIIQVGLGIPELEIDLPGNRIGYPELQSTTGDKTYKDIDPGTDATGWWYFRFKFSIEAVAGFPCGVEPNGYQITKIKEATIKPPFGVEENLSYTEISCNTGGISDSFADRRTIGVGGQPVPGSNASQFNRPVYGVYQDNAQKSYMLAIATRLEELIPNEFMQAFERNQKNYAPPTECFGPVLDPTTPLPVECTPAEQGQAQTYANSTNSIKYWKSSGAGGPFESTNFSGAATPYDVSSFTERGSGDTIYFANVPPSAGGGYLWVGKETESWGDVTQSGEGGFVLTDGCSPPATGITQIAIDNNIFGYYLNSGGNQATNSGGASTYTITINYDLGTWSLTDSVPNVLMTGPLDANNAFNYPISLQSEWELEILNLNTPEVPFFQYKYNYSQKINIGDYTYELPLRFVNSRNSLDSDGEVDAGTSWSWSLSVSNASPAGSLSSVAAFEGPSPGEWPLLFRDIDCELVPIPAYCQELPS
jgi:hypothetical protein